KVVIDASVVAKWAIPGEDWDAEAKALRDKISSGEVEAYAPTLLLYEVASVMLKAALTGILKPTDGVEALKAMGRLGVNIQATGWNELPEILEMATATKLTIYDSVYLHTSKKIGSKLVTADDELKQKGKGVSEIMLLKDLTNALTKNHEFRIR
ncbi:type II toxin-antitoxin system VapC family toxin, partial [Candidatus Bathyarchaeota archaeon]|nr:type II toxin-antitoxin system VapC family toxin [Candidatus Bathyarchaeota archaeon]